MVHTPSSPDPETILAALAEPTRALLTGLDDGVSFADLIMDSQPPDTHVWAMLVRYHACNKIAPKANDQEWSFRKLANCGLEFQLGAYRIRALRTLDDNPPNPGHNNARRQFYRQHHQYQITYDGLPEPPSVGANLPSMRGSLPRLVIRRPNTGRTGDPLSTLVTIPWSS